PALSWTAENCLHWLRRLVLGCFLRMANAQSSLKVQRVLVISTDSALAKNPCLEKIGLIFRSFAFVSHHPVLNSLLEQLLDSLRKGSGNVAERYDGAAVRSRSATARIVTKTLEG